MTCRGSAPALEDPADVRRLPGMLQIVGDHAYEPDAEGDRRVPPLVHDPIKVGVGHAPDELERVEADSVVVPAAAVRRRR